MCAIEHQGTFGTRPLMIKPTEIAQDTREPSVRMTLRDFVHARLRSTYYKIGKDTIPHTKNPTVRISPIIRNIPALATIGNALDDSVFLLVFDEDYIIFILIRDTSTRAIGTFNYEDPSLFEKLSEEFRRLKIYFDYQGA